MDREPIKVLLIEDGIFATRLAQKMLAEAESPQFKAELQCADCLSAGLESLARGAIDIVLLDLTLPDSGELDTFIKVNVQAPEVPIVVLTGLEDEALAIEAVHKGAQDYLVKGQLDGELLKRSILYAIERKWVEEELRGYQERLEDLVEKRTTELQKVNKQLRSEVIVRKRAEEKLRKTYDELKTSQAQLVQSEKLSAIGTLTAGLAHELNNPLMGVLNFIQFCIQKTDEGDRRYSLLQKAERETLRIIDLVKNLLTFSCFNEQSQNNYQKENCAEIFDRVFNLLSYRFKDLGVEIVRRTGRDTPEISMDSNKIQQVFFNLILNALDALNNGKPGKRKIRVDIKPLGDFIRVIVADNGSGIPGETLPKIYDPFFTTKPVGKGTGLGLSISRSIIESHGGSMSCKSRLGKGTIFKVLLPIVPGSRREESYG